jgi:hypothetical protein
MTARPLATIVLTLASILLARPEVRGDYFFAPLGPTVGQVTVTSYPTALQPGQANISFDGSWFSSGASPTGLDAVAFNTDLHLDPSQIAVPNGWTLTPNATVPGHGQFSWLARSSAPQFDNLVVGVTISGLGNNPSAWHFWLPSQGTTPATFAFHDAAIAFFPLADEPSYTVSQGWDSGWGFAGTQAPEIISLTSAPEPSALLLAGLGLAGLLGGRALHRRRTRACT